MNQTTHQPNHDDVVVSLVSGPDGEDCVAIQLANGERMLMSPAQARGLATSLITAVNRAEVKVSLRLGSNPWRRMGEPNERYARAAG